MTAYRFEKLSPANIADLLPVYFNAFGKVADIAFLTQKQNTSVFGESYCGYIAYSNTGEPAAFYGVFPCLIEYNGKKFLAAQSGDTMTHSDHTGKGLFTALAQQTYDYCRAHGIHLVFGFPNKNSYPGFVKKLCWKHFDDMIAYTVYVRCLPWIRIKNALGISSQLHGKWCRTVLSFFPAGSIFKSSCLMSETPVIDHSPDFFNYKKYSQNFLINVNGINIWLKFDDDYLLVGDMEKCEEAVFIKTIRTLKKIAFFLGLSNVRFHCSSNTWIQPLLEIHARKKKVTYPVGGINFSNEIPMEEMKFTMADNDTF